MLGYILGYIKSFFWPTNLAITENPSTYIARSLSFVSGDNYMYIDGGSLYYNIRPINYQTLVMVDDDMSMIGLDNTVAKIENLYYNDEIPKWPKFMGKQPTKIWTSGLLLYMKNLNGPKTFI